MHVFLTRELKSWVNECISTGIYRSEGHLVRRALRLLQEHDKARAIPQARQEPLVDQTLQPMITAAKG